MDLRIIKSEINGRAAFFPQYKPNILVQLLQLSFEWRFFKTTTVVENEARLRHFRTLDDAIKFLESGVFKDTFAKMVVWQDGKPVVPDEAMKASEPNN